MGNLLFERNQSWIICILLLRVQNDLLRFQQRDQMSAWKVAQMYKNVDQKVAKKLQIGPPTSLWADAATN